MLMLRIDLHQAAQHSDFGPLAVMTHQQMGATAAQYGIGSNQLQRTRLIAGIQRQLAFDQLHLACVCAALHVGRAGRVQP